MLIRLSDMEMSILLGATLMHWGVPFRRTARQDMTEYQQAMLDAASDKLIALRESSQRSLVQENQGVPLSDEEAALLITVVEDCLSECGNDPTEMRLQLKTSDCSEVKALLERVRASLGPAGRAMEITLIQRPLGSTAV